MASQARMDRARKRLEQYRNAQHELDYLSSRIETLEAKVMRATTTPDVHAGWTGQYWGRSAKGYGWMYSDNPNDLLNPRKVKAIAKAQHGTSDPKAGEKLLIALVDYQLDYERQALEALDLVSRSSRKSTSGAMRHMHVLSNIGTSQGYHTKKRDANLTTVRRSGSGF